MKDFVKKFAAFVLSVLLMSGCVKQPEFQSDVISDIIYSEESLSKDEQTPEEIMSDINVWNELSSEEITNRMGLGWNLGNQLEASVNGIPNESAWGNPAVTEQLIKTVKEQGFSTVRIPVSYLLKIGSAPDYTIDNQWLDRVQEVVDYVVGNDMFAVINIHGDGYYTVDNAWLFCVSDNQHEIKSKLSAVWRQIAERFKDYDEHLIFESMNEIFDNTYGLPSSEGYDNINAYNQIFVDTVRKSGGNNSARWLIIPGWNTNIEYTCGDYGFEIPTDSFCTATDKRIMISVHYYDPYNFTLNTDSSAASLQWGKYATEKYDDWGGEEYVDKQFRLLNERFVKQGYPVFIGELGVQDKSHISDKFSDYRRYWYEYVVKSARENGCVPVCWDNGWNGENGLALIDRTSCSITQHDIISAMVRAMNGGDYEIINPYTK